MILEIIDEGYVNTIGPKPRGCCSCIDSDW